MNKDIAGYITLVTSFILSFGLYAQAYKIYKTKSAEDFSSGLIIGLALNEVAWLNYGINLGETPVWLVPVINLPAIALAVPAI